MMKTKLARAVAMTLAGGALTMGAVSSASAAQTMYNTFTAATANPDGWTMGLPSAGGGSAQLGQTGTGLAGGAASNANPSVLQPWLGTSGYTNNPTLGALEQRPFGFTGSSHLNWAVALTGTGDNAQISTADAEARYGLSGSLVEIDTGAGAWLDTEANPQGWKHQTDIGLIKSDTNTWVNLNLTRLAEDFGNFGVTIFTGMDTYTGNYSHHGAWNKPASGIPFNANNPLYGTGPGQTGVAGSGQIHMKYDSTVDSLNTISFFALANQVYTIALGGNGGPTWNGNVSNYKLDITATASPVPVPAAAWLFGGALMSLFGANRRKKVLPA